MKIKEFKEQNTVFAKNQPEYKPLPALKLDGDGQVVTCWSLSAGERLRVLFTGKIWVSLLSFGNPLMPQFLSTRKKDHFTNNLKSPLKRFLENSLRRLNKLIWN
jgi:hypothetical protein